MNVLRAGSTGLILGHRVMAPSTLGTFSAAFTFGHVRQLDHVLDTSLGRAWDAGAGPGDGPLVIDIDSFVGEVHGDQKQGASYGYTRQLGYDPFPHQTQTHRPLPAARLVQAPERPLPGRDACAWPRAATHADPPRAQLLRQLITTRLPAQLVLTLVCRRDLGEDLQRDLLKLTGRIAVRVARQTRAIDRDQRPLDQPRLITQPKHLTKQLRQRSLVTYDEPRDSCVVRHHVPRDHPVRHILATVTFDPARGPLLRVIKSVSPSRRQASVLSSSGRAASLPLATST